jgi:hypothetical protein
VEVCTDADLECPCDLEYAFWLCTYSCPYMCDICSFLKVTGGFVDLGHVRYPQASHNYPFEKELSSIDIDELPKISIYFSIYD